MRKNTQITIKCGRNPPKQIPRSAVISEPPKQNPVVAATVTVNKPNPGIDATKFKPRDVDVPDTSSGGRMAFLIGIFTETKRDDCMLYILQLRKLLLQLKFSEVTIFTTNVTDYHYEQLLVKFQDFADTLTTSDTSFVYYIRDASSLDNTLAPEDLFSMMSTILPDGKTRGLFDVYDNAPGSKFALTPRGQIIEAAGAIEEKKFGNSNLIVYMNEPRDSESPTTPGAITLAFVNTMFSRCVVNDLGLRVYNNCDAGRLQTIINHNLLRDRKDSRVVVYANIRPDSVDW